MITDGILSGVSYIHESLQTVHRDLKPSNIFMNKNLELKIGDLGLIKPFVSRDCSDESNLSSRVSIRKMSDNNSLRVSEDLKKNRFPEEKRSRKVSEELTVWS